MACPYEHLGLRKDARPEIVKAVIRAALLLDHPDKGGTAQAFRRTRMACDAIRGGSEFPAAPPSTPALTSSLRTVAGMFRKPR